MKSSKKAFTLVELIIVIAIIAILAVTAFLVLTKWLGKSRDSRRVSDLSTMDTALQVYVTEKSVLPRPDNAITINASGTAIGYQGVFTDNTMSALGNIKPTPLDPTDNTNYVYYVDSSSKNYQLLGFTEQTSSVLTTANAVDYSVRFIQTRGSKLGILLSGDNTPINLISGVGTGLDVQNTTGTYNAYFDNTNKLSGTGATLQWLASAVNNGGAGFDAPSSCPTGFIPVPGNKDFNQPGFCVAKYEMKQSIGDAGSWNGVSGSYLTGTTNTPYCASTNPCNNLTGGLTGSILGIQSKAEGYPIVWINQYNAIQACQSMGNGYHLVTNNERMTVSRNIEANKSNWGYDKFDNNDQTKTYYGINRGNGSFGALGMSDGSIGALPATGSEYGFSGGVQQSSFLFKRTHTLSNGQSIRDMGANVRERVNGANTLNGTGYDKMYANMCNNATNSRYSYTGYAASCTFTGGYSYNIVGPLNNMAEQNGAGEFYSPNVTTYDRVFLRGGGHRSAINVGHGIYALFLGMINTSVGIHAGFRCAR